jgi:microcystin-dependent protein
METPPFLGEIRIMSFSFAPQGWTLCNGSLLPIAQNQALFSLLGTMYGGNGSTNFALPDLRGRIPMHVQGNVFYQGERAGEAAHTLSINEMPTHAHVANATNASGNSNLPQANLLANANLNAYAQQNPPQNIEPGTLAVVGGSQAHNNMSPYLVLNFCIALQGVFPTHS